MSMTIEQALESISRRFQSLNNVPVDKAVVPAAEWALVAAEVERLRGAGLPADPARPDILERLTYHALERDDMSLDDCLSFLANGWKTVRGRSEREVILQLTALLASAPAAPAPLCACGARPAAQCDEQWGPGCSLGNSEAHAAPAPDSAWGARSIAAERATVRAGIGADEVPVDLHEALAAYWDAAYAEGREGRDHDTPDGAAQRALAAVHAAVRRMCAAPVAAEPVAMIGETWSLLWFSPDPISDIAARHGLHVGSMLYAAPVAQPQPIQQLDQPTVIGLWGSRSDAPDNIEIITFARAVIGEFCRLNGITGSKE